jgi:host factor-I protein
MSKSQLNLQDSFLNQVRKENIPVTLYLTSGVQLRGQVKGFDAFTVILEGQGKPPQLVYKHSIVSVAPMRHPSSLLPVPPEGAPREEGVPGVSAGPAPGSEVPAVPAPIPAGVAAEGAAPPPTPEPGPDE